PKFLNAVFSQWTVEDTIQFFENFGGIKPQEKTLGQLFPTTNKAKDIVATFTKLLYETGQDSWLNTLVKAVDKVDQGDELFIIRNGKEERLATQRVVFASGGLAVHNLGGSAFALRVARQFTLDIV